MDRYHQNTPKTFGFPKKGQVAGLMKTCYNSLFNVGAHTPGQICPAKGLFELNFGAIRRKNSHFNLLMLWDNSRNF